MNPEHSIPRRQMLLASAGAVGGSVLAAANSTAGDNQPVDNKPAKTYRIGVISATIRGKPQPRNGHTWHFAQYLHPRVDWDALKRHEPASVDYYQKTVRNPKFGFDLLPFPDTEITHYYDAEPKHAAEFLEAYPGGKVAKSVEELASEVDAVWLGDASGYGDDHFDLIAPALKKGLPTFCDKPIGGSVAGTRKILDFAREHQAPIMSSSLFRHEWGAEAAVRMRDAGEFGPIQYLIASVQGGYREDGWLVYGQHPAWTVVTLMGPGAEAVSMYARENTCHALVTYPDRMPAEIWFGRPNPQWEYCHTEVHFQKKKFEYTASIEGDFWYGHHYEMFRMAETFRQMVKTRKEPIPHAEILEVTAIVFAAAKSRDEQSRLVKLTEVM